jgi:2'-5' RNA ligase
VRAFLAVAADAAWVASARDFTARLQERLPRAAWTRPESWHLTVRFLGEVTEEAASRFAEGIGPAAAALSEGEIAGAGPVVFPARGRARVLGIGFGAETVGEALGALARAAEGAARSIGCPPEERPFRPHVTLARLRSPWPPRAVEEFCKAAEAWPFPAWRVRSLVLYRSRLDPAGAVHTPVRQWAAAGSVVEARA